METGKECAISVKKIIVFALYLAEHGQRMNLIKFFFQINAKALRAISKFAAAIRVQSIYFQPRSAHTVVLEKYRDFSVSIWRALRPTFFLDVRGPIGCSACPALISIMRTYPDSTLLR